MAPFPSPLSPPFLLASSAVQRSRCAQGETPARKPRSHTEPTAGPDTHSSLQERNNQGYMSLRVRGDSTKMSTRWRHNGTRLVRPAHWSPEIHLAFDWHPCWFRHLPRSDLGGGERCAGAAASRAGLEIQPGSRWDGQPVPWSSASTGLPSPHLEQAPAACWGLEANSNQLILIVLTAFTFSNGLCEAGEELMVLGQPEWRAFWLLVEITQCVMLMFCWSP